MLGKRFLWRFWGPARHRKMLLQAAPPALGKKSRVQLSIRFSRGKRTEEISTKNMKEWGKRKKKKTIVFTRGGVR